MRTLLSFLILSAGPRPVACFRVARYPSRIRPALREPRFKTGSPGSECWVAQAERNPSGMKRRIVQDDSPAGIFHSQAKTLRDQSVELLFRPLQWGPSTPRRRGLINRQLGPLRNENLLHRMKRPIETLRNRIFGHSHTCIEANWRIRSARPSDACLLPMLRDVVVSEDRRKEVRLALPRGLEIGRASCR